MKSKFFNVVVCLAVLAMLAVPFAFAPIASAAGPPVWSVGDFWNYTAVYNSGPGPVPEVSNTCAFNTSVTSITGANYTLHAAYDPYANRAMQLAPGAFAPLTVLYADVSIDKANMQFQQQLAMVWAYGAPTMPDPATVVWAYTPPPPGYPPLTPWSFTKHTTDAMGIVNVTTNRVGMAVGLETVVTPAGTFDNCLHIVEYDPANPGVYTYEHWFSEAVGTDVKMIDRETYFGEETRTLTSFSYANAPVYYTLTTNATNGSITVDKAPPYLAGTVVNLTAVPALGYQFVNWSGDASGTALSVPVTMDGNKNVTANFELIPPINYTLTTNATNGSITVDKAPPYLAGTVVNLTALPASGYQFVNWSGDASGTALSVPVTMDGNKNVTANFEPIPVYYTLTTNATNGSITGATSGTQYLAGTQVTLTAVPASGYSFTGWSGGATGTINPVTVTMDADKTVNASFAKTAYIWTGFIKPQSNSSFKLGRTVAVAFKLNVSIATATIWITGPSGVEQAGTPSKGTGNTFTYAHGTYKYNLATKGLVKGTWQIRVLLDDGTSHTVNIILK